MNLFIISFNFLILHFGHLVPHRNFNAWSFFLGKMFSQYGWLAQTLFNLAGIIRANIRSWITSRSSWRFPGYLARILRFCRFGLRLGGGGPGRGWTLLHHNFAQIVEIVGSSFHLLVSFFSDVINLCPLGGTCYEVSATVHLLYRVNRHFSATLIYFCLLIWMLFF